jgi:UrcA family protein
MRKLIGIALVAVLSVGVVQAGNLAWDVSEAPKQTIKYDDLNLAVPAGIKTLYNRIKIATKHVCDSDDGVAANSLQRIPSATLCRAQAMERAVQHINHPSLTAYYEQQNHLGEYIARNNVKAPAQSSTGVGGGK